MGQDERAARFERLLADLEAEIGELDDLLGRLTPEQWAWDTQSRGWSVAHQIGHLETTERLMLVALTDEPRFRHLATVVRTKPDIDERELVDPALGPRQHERWRESRAALLAEFRRQGPSARMPWVGPSMSLSSAATARIMEIWAHGEDVYDAVGATRRATDRLRHIAHLAVTARDYSFVNRGLAAPAEPFRVEIRGPSGALWTWGPEDAAQRVEGDAYDFALLATRRLHRSDADVRAEGRDAVTWLRTIQAYAGPPGPRRRPLGAARRLTVERPGPAAEHIEGFRETES